MNTTSETQVAEVTGLAGPGMVQLVAIQPSPTNPRKSFDAEKLNQLAETIRAQGFLQRLLVRPLPGKPDTFELVDGERRWRAAAQLGIAVVPVDVRNLTDGQVIEIQLVAGETGEPLTPLEEGAGFKTALELRDTASGQPVYTLRSLAEKLGCGKTHIEQRLNLLRLPKSVREWVSSGSLAPRTANLLARIPDPVAMESAIQAVVFPKHREDPLPYKEAEAVIHERYMVSLRNAPFDLNDATFDGPVLDEVAKKWLPQACATCPLKTGNDCERFGDVKDANTCTKPSCYRARCNAAWERAAAKAKAAGQRVLTDEEAAEVFEKNSPVVQIAFSSPYVDVDSKPNYRHVPNEVEDKNLPTWRELITTAAEKKGIKVPIVLARDRTGKQWQLVQMALCIEAARAIGEDFFRKTPVNESISSKDRFDRDGVRTAVRQTDDFAAKKKAEADAARKRALEGALALRSLHSALAGKMIGAIDVTDALLPTALHHAGNDGLALVVKAFGLRVDGGGFGFSDAVEAWFRKLPFARRHASIPILLIAQSVRWNGLKCEGFTALAEAVELDVEAIEKQVAEGLGAKGKPGKAKAPAAASAPASGPGPEPEVQHKWNEQCECVNPETFAVKLASDRKATIYLGANVEPYITSLPRTLWRAGYQIDTLIGKEWNRLKLSSRVQETRAGAVRFAIERIRDVLAFQRDTVGLKALTAFIRDDLQKITDPAATNFGLTEGKYIAVKTLLTADKPHKQIAEQLGISVGQVDGVAQREKITSKAPGKKPEPGKRAEAAVRGSLKKTAKKGGKKK